MTCAIVHASVVNDAQHLYALFRRFERLEMAKGTKGDRVERPERLAGRYVWI